jgi:hypothetical protein
MSAGFGDATEARALAAARPFLFPASFFIEPMKYYAD